MYKRKLLLLAGVVLPLLMTLGCKKDLSYTTDIDGTWKMSQQLMNGKLRKIIAPPNNAHFPDISFTIPQTKKGRIIGNTFRNSMGFDFEIDEDGKVIYIRNYGGTRVDEDRQGWGDQYIEHLFQTDKILRSKNELHFLNTDGRPIMIFKEK